MVASDKASSKQPGNLTAIDTPQSSIDTILRRLTNRPNVESTLILSRKDGSIIKTAGMLSAEQKRSVQSIAAYSANDSMRTSANRNTTDSISSEELPVGTEEHITQPPAEELASSVFQFVTSASFLGTTLCSVAVQVGEEDGAALRHPRQGDNLSNETALEDSEDVRGESQVQLIRLRVKSREIIIFPDPHYLCCVVQRVGKQGNAADGR